MQIIKEKILKRISELKEISIDGNTLQSSEELFIGTLSIATTVYGTNSPQLRYLIDLRDKVANSKYMENEKYLALYHATMGYIKNLENEVNDDMIYSLEKIISGDLFSDFMVMAKEAMDSGQKDVAVVLTCAALEDSLKRLAKIKNIDVENKEMAETINTLKSKEIISGPQLKVIQSYTKLRNKAFHAEWDKIDTPEVKSLIAFLEEFILKHFSE
ncbi:hypothetical protein [Leptospira alstonii]|uniref:hypothetical protein n=1 Tax=Leptospira alstonii TaxID=28452 RepID=UPI000AE05403|nr:hypothetical protein [Leptospira alstonii]